jgi:coenzyme Q-binding protein COQ10
VISSVESYSQFLPFLTASTVTHRDPETWYPTRAFLTVGYGPLSETFTSRVDCDRSRWIVEARSGAKFGVDSKDGQAGANFPGATEGIFEYLSTKWELVPLENGSTKVDLEIRFEFRNQLHAAMMGAVEGQMAGVMIEAFEKRIRDVQGR